MFKNSNRNIVKKKRKEDRLISEIFPMFRFWMVPEGFGWSMRVLDGPWWFWMVPDGRDG